MKPNDLPTLDPVRAAMQAILAGKFDAPEVHEVLQGRAGSSADYWKVRNERGLQMDIERRAAEALLEIRIMAAKARRQVDEILGFARPSYNGICRHCGSRECGPYRCRFYMERQ